MRHLVSKRWVVRKTCLSAPVVIPPKYSCLYLSLLRLYPSRLKEQAGNLKHHLLCSLMITLGDRSTTFSSLACNTAVLQTANGFPLPHGDVCWEVSKCFIEVLTKENPALKKLHCYYGSVVLLILNVSGI